MGRVLKTKIFELFDKNYPNLTALSQAMGLSVSTIYRVKEGNQGIGVAFIAGALRAFPEYKFENLFYLIPEKQKKSTRKGSKLEQTDVMLTVREVAQLINVHVNTVRGWSNKGLLKAYRIGSRGDRRYRQEDITNFLK